MSDELDGKDAELWQKRICPPTGAERDRLDAARTVTGWFNAAVQPGIRMNVEAAARTLQANTWDSLDNSKDWDDMTWQEREKWRDRALMVIKAGQEA